MVPIRTQHPPTANTTDKPLRILIVTTDFEPGGTAIQSSRLAKGLTQLGCSVCIAALGRSTPLADRAAAADLRVVPLGARDIRDLSVIGRLIRLITSFKPDICQSFLVHANVATRISAAFSTTGTVVSTICTAERQHRWHLMLENATWRLAGCIVCVSNAVRNHMHRHAHIPDPAMTVIYPGLDVEALTTATPTARELLTSQPHCPLACYVGRLDHLKRVDLVIDAIHKLSLAGKTMHLVIVGDGPARSDLQQRSERYNLTDRIRFTGLRHDVAAILRSCDLYVSASDQEGWCLATAEALTCRLPAVVTDVDGAAEQVVVGQTGYLVPPGDVNSLSTAMLSAVELKATQPNRPAWQIPGGIDIDYMREARQYHKLYTDLMISKRRI